MKRIFKSLVFIVLLALMPVVAYAGNVVLDPMLEHAKGTINESSVNKFGRAPSGVQATATDIWDRADASPTQSIWIKPTVARIHQIVSTSTADDGAPVGTGARTVRIFGLTSWNTKEVTEVIIMNGTTDVPTTNAYVIIHRMRVLTYGALSINVGAISATADTDSTVTAQINANAGQTQMAIYGVPSVNTAYLTQWYGTLNKASGAAATINFSLKFCEDPEVGTDTAFWTKNTRGVQSTGTSGDTWPFRPYYKIKGPAIIKVQATASAADIEGSAGFDIILRDE